jgi:hypothetical protein
MFVSPMLPEFVLRECPDRRRQERFIHRETVHVDGHPVTGRDVSASGMGVVMRTAVRTGELVHVTFENDSQTGRSTTVARVARVQHVAGRVIVGLHFVNQ